MYAEMQKNRRWFRPGNGLLIEPRLRTAPSPMAMAARDLQNGPRCRPLGDMKERDREKF
jgi:hypothetical protein